MLEIKEVHECNKPNMVLAVRTVTEKTGRLFFRRTHTIEEPIYDSREARFICEECGAKWAWLSRFWYCESRPEKWRNVDTGEVIEGKPITQRPPDLQRKIIR